MNPLDSFLERLLHKYKNPQSLFPETMAEEWVGHSGLSALPSLSEIHRQLEAYGLALEKASLPGLRGHHYCYRGGDPTILYESDEWRGAVEFTLLHEFYEIILDKMGSGLRCQAGSSRAEACWGGNRFAAAVLMQKDIFLQALHESHFDIIWLHRHFYRSYSAIAIRAQELLDRIGTPAKKELACIIYQRDGDPRQWDDGRQGFYVRCAVYTNGIRRGKGRGQGHPMPARKDSVPPGSIVELALQVGRPVLLKKARGLGPAEDSSLTCLARPVYWFHKPAKVILEAMKLEDGYILEAQAQPLHPQVVEEADGLVCR